MNKYTFSFLIGSSIASITLMSEEQAYAAAPAPVPVQPSALPIQPSTAPTQPSAVPNSESNVNMPLAPPPMVAFGQPEQRQGPAKGEFSERWYGKGILASGFTGLGVSTLGLFLAFSNGALGSGLALMGGTGYLLGAPIQHWARGHIGKGFASLGINLAGTGLGGLIGVGVGLIAAKNCRGDLCGIGEVFFGMVTGAYLGSVGSVLIDGLALAHDPVKKAPTMGISPFIAPSKDRFLLGATGYF